MAASLEASAVEVCSTAKEYCTELLEAAKARAVAATGGVNKMVLTSRSCVQGTMSATREAVNVKLTEGRCTAEETWAVAQDYVASVQDRLAASYSNLSTKGIEAFMREGASRASGRALTAADSLSNSAAERYNSTKERTVEAIAKASELAKEASMGVGDAVGDRHLQVSAVSAVGGAVALGTGGAATGLAAGGAIGVAIGLVPAPFTLGLSVPIAGAIGSGVGLTVGTAAGSAIGAAGGSVAGYCAYSKKDDIGRAAEYVKVKAAETSEFVKMTSAAAMGHAREVAGEAKARACATAGYAVEKASATRCRLAGSGTGSTEVTD